MSNKKYASAAAKAMAQLYVFDAVVGALENGAIICGGSSERAAQKIIVIAKKEQARQLAIYDKQVGRISS